MIRKDSRILVSAPNKLTHDYHTNFPLMAEDELITIISRDLAIALYEINDDYGAKVIDLLRVLRQVPGIKKLSLSTYQLRIEIYPAFSWEEIDTRIEMAIIVIHGEGQPDGSFETRRGGTWDLAATTKINSPEDSLTGE